MTRYSCWAYSLDMPAETNHADEETLVSREVMQQLRISRSTLDRMVRNGRLRATKIEGGHRRYFQADVNAALIPALVVGRAALDSSAGRDAA